MTHSLTNSPQDAGLKPAAAFVGDPANIARVYARGRWERVAELTRLYPTVLEADDLSRAELAGIEVIFSTWGMPRLETESLDRLPCLKAVFYAAGSVHGFARPLLDRSITVVSAWRANAIPVAEFTLAQILLSNKGYWRDRTTGPAPGNFGETVSLLGAGAVGREVIRMLKPFVLNVTVYDPFLGDADALELGARKVSFEDAFRIGIVVSNHLADKPQTKRLIGETQFRLMREGATFINTGRGATVDEAALVRVLADRPSLTALLDVTEPEPPVPGSPLFDLPNIHLTPHIAGAIGGEVLRMADIVIDEFQSWQRGAPLTSAVTMSMLSTMA
ncbi:MAG: hydroxyacid dehydrogenase [Capsulimonadaceae bacterium]